MGELKIKWGIETNVPPSQLRAFVRIITPSGQVVAERLTPYRLMSGDEYAFMQSDAEDAKYEYTLARDFWPQPEAIEGVSEAAVATWLRR